ncbi:bacteriohemerythrin [Faecalicatena contorta]|uniref:Hemerythrin n=1 Tax=Faecalicatena contorta TaxID=39482 RepID=A0A316A534_9FIRM|nr:hemerythrin family protein [Faecalicatena contorta]PWJ52070.1 hemerythrin [Faecalicatena contorta]SUQ12348.1 hemerythrin [Faecalicatena contorta]
MLWKEKYELGDPNIDEQHKELFQRVEEFMKNLRSAVPWEEKVASVNETLEFMNGYVVEHFRDEEEYQQRIQYPGYEIHKKIHKDMVDYVLQVTAEYEKSGFDEQLMQQFGGKLLAWLINHVASEDQKIATYAIKKGVAGNE